METGRDETGSVGTGLSDADLSDETACDPQPEA